MSTPVLLISVHGNDAGLLRYDDDSAYTFEYLDEYDGPPVSLTMPVSKEAYAYTRFPPFFDGLLPEGWQLEALLRRAKLDRHDYMGQLSVVGDDPVGAVTVTRVQPNDQ